MLDGITVVDLSQVGPGPRCTSALADLGASVVKVLPPAGRIEPEPWAYGAGRGTRRVRIDLKRGAEVFLRLAERVDVVVESYRPGVADRLGIGYEAVQARNPSVVYAAVTGYGQDGPYAQWAGHDINYLGVGGLLGSQGVRAGGGPALPGATIADAAAGGWQAALTLCAALLRRDRTGEGAFLDVSTTEGVLALMSINVDGHLATGAGPQILTGRYACYDVYPARDGKWLSVGAIEPKFFANLCEALGLEELAVSQHDLDRQDEIRSAFREAFARKDRDEWVSELAPRDTCVAPVLHIDELWKDEHLVSRRAFGEAVLPDGTKVRQVGPVLAGAVRSPDPAVAPSGSDADELLSEAGFGPEEIAGLRASGVVE
jgi:alpha-methylacyl-CoA racemase